MLSELACKHYLTTPLPTLPRAQVGCFRLGQLTVAEPGNTRVRLAEGKEKARSTKVGRGPVTQLKRDPDPVIHVAFPRTPAVPEAMHAAGWDGGVPEHA